MGLTGGDEADSFSRCVCLRAGLDFREAGAERSSSFRARSPHPYTPALHALAGRCSGKFGERVMCMDAEARRVVLATNIAESSLTIEGVRAVVDSGVVRVPVQDEASGLTRLTTIPASRNSVDQRRGRAGARTCRLSRAWLRENGIDPSCRPFLFHPLYHTTALPLQHFPSLSAPPLCELHALCIPCSDANVHLSHHDMRSQRGPCLVVLSCFSMYSSYYHLLASTCIMWCYDLNILWHSVAENFLKHMQVCNVVGVVAGRLGPGRCYRMWSEAHDKSLQEEATPEILGADLAPLALQLASWREDQPVGGAPSCTHFIQDEI